ncbi:MAG: DNRLRE domain-containing protein [Candidatus Korarchaeum sp.]
MPLSILILILSVGGVVSAPPPIHPTITFIPPPWIPLLPIEKELRASADSTLFNAYPNNNYGGESELVVGRKVITTPIYKVLLWETVVGFDVYNEIPPGSEVTEAQLILTIKEPPSSGVNLEALPLINSFTESTVTWTSYSSSYGSAITTQTVSFDAHDGTKVIFDVTPFVKSKVQTGETIYGFLLKVPPTTNDGIIFYSKEGAPQDGWRPTLRISYKTSYVDLVASQESLELTQGSNAYVQLSVGGTFDGEAKITHQWAGVSPIGVSTQLSKTSGNVPFASTIRIAVSGSTPPGEYDLEVKAENKYGSYSIHDKLIIKIKVISAAEPDFTLSISPASITVAQGGMAEYSVTVTPVAGFSGEIHFSASGMPSGSTQQLVSSGSNIYLRIATSSSTPPGDYTITVTAQGDGKSHEVSVALTVTAATTTTSTGTVTTTTMQPSFFIDVNPNMLTLARGGIAHLSVRVQGIGGFSNTVTLSASGLPQGVTISSNINNSPPDFTADLVLSATNQAPLGMHQFTLLAVGGGVTRSSTITLTILEQRTGTQTQAQPETQTSAPTQATSFDFDISITPQTLILNPGTSGSVAVTVRRISGSGTVALLASGLPSDVSVEFNPPSLEEGTSSLIIRSGRTTGTFTVVVTGSSDGMRKSATFQLQIKAEESRCIIATAAFGSELAPEVSHLRDFRDRVVMSTYSGSRFLMAFNIFYYSWSSHVASAIRGNYALSGATRIAILPLLIALKASSALYSALPHGEVSMILMGAIASMMLGIIYLWPLSLVSLRLKRTPGLRLVGSVVVAAVTSAALLGVSTFLALDSLAMLSSASLVLSCLLLSPLLFSLSIKRLN